MKRSKNRLIVPALGQAPKLFLFLLRVRKVVLLHAVEQRPNTPLPPDFVEMVRIRFPDEADQMLRALDQEPSVSVFLNASKPAAGIFSNAENVPWASSGRILENRPSFTLDPLFQAGCYYVMESSSMFLDTVLRQVLGTAPVCALDLCAAPGGKSVVTLSALPAGSLLVANEVNRARWNILQQNLDKWGSPNVVSISSDPGRIPWPGKFDCVLVDAPCSGEGLFRKDPTARDEWSPAHVALCSARQKRILHEAERLLRPGGLLIYSTCTWSAEEDLDQLLWLHETYGYAAVQVEVPLDWGVSMVSKEDIPGYQFLPHRVPGEGFFCGVLRKPGEHEEEDAAFLTEKKGKSSPVRALNNWIAPTESGGHVWTWEKNGSQWVVQSAIDPMFTTRIPGVRFGTETGNSQERVYTPPHALALSTILSESVPSIELNAEEAIRFLRKDQIQLDAPGKGWYVATYEGFGLGWFKQTGAGLKNYYPTNLRIRQTGH